MAELIIYCEDYDFSALSKAFCGEFAADVDIAAEILFTDKDVIRELNSRFRNTDKITDVLSFPTLEGILSREIRGEDFPYDRDENGRLFIGSIAICTEVAKEQAAEYGHSYERELNYLAVHGICHLLGYDHIEDGDRAVMRGEEEKVLKKLGLNRE